MEKRTIGSFIAALRKANGLTQKQLAEKLCVSDKAISRWERDECAPDLSAIPVLAEIFGVTCDELLRGQRSQTPAGQEETVTQSINTKQLSRLLTSANTRYKTLSAVSIGIALVGLLAGMICNFAFQRGYLGFMMGCIFLVVAVIYQAAITIQTTSTLNTGDFPTEVISDARFTLFKTCRITVAIILGILASMIPFLLVEDAYFGITLESWLPLALLFVVISALAAYIIGSVVCRVLDQNGYFHMTDRQRTLRRLSSRCIALFLVSLAGLWLVHLLAQELASEHLYPGTKFNNWDDFKTFMETPVQYGNSSSSELIITQPIDPDMPFSDDLAWNKETITDAQGNILCEYLNKNEAVCSMSFSFQKNENGLPVTARTYHEYSLAQRFIIRVINPIFYFLYLLLPVLSWLNYRKRAKKIS